jgi:DNA-binding CsgD family transcriptional regulator
MPNGSHERYYQLTPAEAQLLRLLAEGKTPGEIATAMNDTVAEVRECLMELAARLRAS